MQKVVTCLWFDGNAEEAARFYIDVFGDGQIVSAGPVMVEFDLFGQRFQGLNGGPQFRFTEAISMAVGCDGQEEVDRYWNALIADGGSESQCGWCKDRFGLSWQIIPKQLGELMGSDVPGAGERVMDAMLTMSKLDVAALQRAHDAG